MLLVFAALIEFAIVNSFARKALRCDRMADRVLTKHRATASMPPSAQTSPMNVGFVVYFLSLCPQCP